LAHRPYNSVRTNVLHCDKELNISLTSVMSAARRAWRCFYPVLLYPQIF